jgi:hypothetical protein
MSLEWLVGHLVIPDEFAVHEALHSSLLESLRYPKLDFEHFLQFNI